jgi:tRNA G18 (ribose-2'-O)-methylase SpoU
VTTKTRGFFAIGIEHNKTRANIGTLWRTANLFCASFIFTVGARYDRQSSDTMSTPRHMPLFHFASLDDLYSHLPYACRLIGIELDDRATPIQNYRHPQQACYLLGAEDHGLTKAAVERCHHLVKLPGRRSMNVATAGGIVIYDRWRQLEQGAE